MDNSIYVALSRQLAVFRDMDMTANNLANVNTPGFHAERMIFTDYLVDEGKRTTKLAFTQDIASYRDTTNGPMKTTGGALDVAIQGPGFFVVETGKGERFTRAGNFTIGSDGTLMTVGGHPVLGNGGQRIEFQDTDREIMIGENGVISAKNPQGGIEARGELALVEFDDPQELLREGSQYFTSQQQPEVAARSRVLQGVIENSNVSPIEELVKVTRLSRSTSSSAKFIEVMYDLERKTANAYARRES